MYVYFIIVMFLLFRQTNDDDDDDDDNIKIYISPYLTCEEIILIHFKHKLQMIRKYFILSVSKQMSWITNDVLVLDYFVSSSSLTDMYFFSI